MAYRRNPLSKIQNPKPANERMMWTEYSHLARACQILFRLRIADCGFRIENLNALQCYLFNPQSEIRNPKSREVCFSFGMAVEPVGRQVLKSLAQSRGPAYLQDIDACRRAQPEVQHELVLAHVARAGLYLGDRSAARHRDRRARAHCASVALRPLQGQAEPVIAVPALVEQDQRRVIHVVDNQIQVAVVIQVRVGAAAAAPLPREARLEPYLPERAVAEVLEKQDALPVLRVQGIPINLRIDMPIDHVDVQVAVVVGIKKPRGPAEIVPRRLEVAGAAGHITKEIASL